MTRPIAPSPAPVQFPLPAVDAVIPVQNPPTWLKSLPREAILQGLVQQRSGTEVVIVTAQGRISLPPSIQAPLGTTLSAHVVENARGQLALQIVGSGLPQAGIPMPTDQVVRSAALPLPPAPSSAALPALVNGITVQATVLRTLDSVETGAPPLSQSTAGPAAVSPRTVGTGTSGTGTLGTGMAGPGGPVPVTSGGMGLGPTLAPAGAAGMPQPMTPVAPGTPLTGPGQVALGGSPAAPNAPFILSPAGGPAAGPSPTAGTLAPGTLAPGTLAPGTLAPGMVPAGQPGATPMPLSTQMVGAQPGMPSMAGDSAAQSARTAAGSAATAGPPSMMPLSATGLPNELARAPLGGQLPLRIIGTTPPPQIDPSAPVTTTAVLPAGGTSAGGAQGLVIGTSTTGRPLVSVGPVLLMLDSQPLAPGSIVTLAPQGPAVLPNGPAQRPQLPLPGFPSLPEVLGVGNEIGGRAQAALDAMVPKPGPRFAADMVVFLSAVSRGDIRLLLGDDARDAIQKTERGRRGLSRLSSEFAEAARDAAAPTDWRAVTIPVRLPDRVEPIRLFMHGVREEEQEGGQSGKGGGGQRFLFDLTLSATGPLQLDGFTRDNRLDLMVRTERPLAEPLRQGIARIFADATSARGLQGTLGFQIAPRFVPQISTSDFGRPGIMV